MADNVGITSGSGTAIACDDIGSVFYQRVKLAMGADGAADMDLDSGQQVMASSLPVAIASNQSAVLTKITGFSIPVTLTVTNGAYTIGDVVGGLITLPNMVSAVGKHAIVRSITLAGVVAIAYELWFLSADIATPAADNATFTLVAADEALMRGNVPILAADYMAAANAFNVATVRNVGLVVQAGAAATSIYAYLKATAITSPGTTTLYLRVSGEYLD
jgi:hypothetical protein